MEFNLLGPLEVIHRGQSLPLNGNKQRATLGFLLLHSNSVVATSRILKALWPVDMPATGRKMLQNAVSGLRGMLSLDAKGPDSALLLTHSPGYLLRVTSGRIDLSRFHDLANSGRADLAARAWERAACTLQNALALWRGSVLSDLVDSGVVWPELTTVNNSRLATLEDYVEAEFARGRYREVISKLEMWVEIEPLRERLCSQLMLALYYCGRQADALGLYRRTRTRLREELGLDPSRELQELERSILNQEPELDSPPAPFRPMPSISASVQISSHEPARQLGGSAQPVPIHSKACSVAMTERPSGEPVEPPMVSDVISDCCAATGFTGYAMAELKRISVVLFMTRFDNDVSDVEPEQVYTVFQHATATVHKEVEHLGGTVQGTIGSIWLALFGAPQNHEDDAVCAVRAAMSVRDRLRSRRLLSSSGTSLAITAAVATGEALVTRQKDDRGVSVTGGVLDCCMALLAHASTDEILVCEATQQASEHMITYDTAGGQINGARPVMFHSEQEEFEPTVPFVDRDHELKMLLSLLDQVRRRSRVHLITIFGEPGVGKSRLITEFRRAISRDTENARYLISRIPCFGNASALTVLLDSVKSYARIRNGDSTEIEINKLANAVRDLAGAGSGSRWMLSHLRTMIALNTGDNGTERQAERQNVQSKSFADWQRFLEEACAGGPLVVIIEDLHKADDMLLDFVNHLTDRGGSFPLLVIVTARPELLDRRPTWGGGKVRASTTILHPLSDDDASRLLTLVCVRNGAHRRHHDPSSTDNFIRSIASCAGGNPLFTIEYARLFQEDDTENLRAPYLADQLLSTDRVDPLPPLPQLIHRILASRLDSLPAEVKTVLLDAAVLGERICEAGLAAVGQRTTGEASFCLEYLVRWEFIRKMKRQSDGAVINYTFRHGWVRDIAYRIIPRAIRADKHRRAAAWLERLPGHNSGLLAYHQRHATALPGPAAAPLLPWPRTSGELASSSCALCLEEDLPAPSAIVTE